MGSHIIIELCMLEDDILSLWSDCQILSSSEISERAQNVVFLMTHQVYQCIHLHFLSLLFYPSCLPELLGVVDLFLPFLRSTESDEFWSRDLKRGSHVFMTISSIHIVQGFRPFGWLPPCSVLPCWLTDYDSCWYGKTTLHSSFKKWPWAYTITWCTYDAGMSPSET